MSHSRGAGGETAPSSNGERATANTQNGSAPVQQRSETSPTVKGDNSASADDSSTTPAVNNSPDQGSESALSIDSKTVSGTNGVPDRIDVSDDGFKELMSASDGSKVEMNGEEFTKISSGSNNGIDSVELENIQTGERHYLYSSDGMGKNLSIE
ncbi:hypothetical protein I7Z51_004594 [Vibrio parahaemolyticus]|uniref:hypothetical protein n=1 Tax=Vibrio TaxID=662 RepID=UPI001A8CED72|nr:MULTISPECIES: hypothetical protein [Vibrio]EGQ7975612.1 hypothetical protein [Vibrio parahaemolyticus]MBO0211145.1 hypothetical protein [Vibrio sp. Vb0877]MCR9808289.1 hypothetical protein [Vibrio parahaemolyticus]